MRIAFRVDSSSFMGSGHLVRCLTLGRGLRRDGAEVSFISRTLAGHLIGRVEEAGFPVACLPAPPRLAKNADSYSEWLGVPIEQDAAETISVLGSTPDWLVVDHYAIDARWEKLLRPRVGAIAVIDDLAGRAHDCDLLVDQGYHGDETAHRYDALTSNLCRRLLGPQYALLQPEYAVFRRALPQRVGPVSRVLVFFGGSDLLDQTSVAVEALSHLTLSHLLVDVVVGANHPNRAAVLARIRSRPRTALHESLPTLAALMTRADLFVGGGGSTSWERACIGLPGIVAADAENHEASSARLAAQGYQQYLGRGEQLTADRWRAEIAGLIHSPAALAELSRRGQTLTDGMGATRIARAICGSADLRVTIRRADRRDEALLLAWANDPIARQVAFSKDRITETDHARWFAERLEDANTLILIGEDSAELPLGQVRFTIDRARDEGVIDISVDPAFRGFGVGEKLLSAAIVTARRQLPGLAFLAEAVDENAASRRLFTKLNFVPAPARHPGSQAFVLSA